ncbi:DNA polymerase Y family protein [Mucilaginibacter sp.]|jgi:protein ImuB|uniref:Y-family DNA polymerase n=1 Tax=Mucilaginibacter sp. TaxID=1882438 RepID=UPI0026123660|nr:DNA polymerase Y family protein [Mucilaginibacter sp.]MDB4926626.1 nucleotidyltransferase [Mucilaginibacter sp.]
MPKRFVSIWFRYLLTDREAIRQKSLRDLPVAFTEPDHGRLLVIAMNVNAEQCGVKPGIAAADARVIAPGIQLFENKPGRNVKLLKGMAEWCLRYTPLVMVDLPDGLLLDVTGCTHLKGGETEYLKDMVSRLRALGYTIRPGMADTIGCAWAVARCAENGLNVPPGGQRNALMPLPPASLRLGTDLLIKLNQLGFYQVSSFIHLPKSVLKRRFGGNMILRLYQALGQEAEFLLPLKEPVPYSERISLLEPVTIRPAIERAVHTLIDQLCKRLYGEGLGLRSAVLTYCRIDGKSYQLAIGTNHPSQRTDHIFKLFELQLDQVAPGLGIELFILDALKTEPASDKQSMLWNGKPTADSEQVAELLDNIAARVGNVNIHRYLPKEHHWPERAAANTADLTEIPASEWRDDHIRPTQLLDPPEPIEAMALTPDYAPRQFVYRNQRHIIVSADGPERISHEWWTEDGGYRDYYMAEDEEGMRYWLFGTPNELPGQTRRWFIHGYFA